MGRRGGRHPAVGLGLWSLGRWEPEDEVRTRAVIDRGLALGLRWFDTAEVYGNGRSERLLGDALAGPPRPAAPFVATKVSWEHLRPVQIRAALTGSLQRLARRAVDLYLVHAPDPHVPIPETMGALEALWKEGKIGAIGVSNFGVEEIEAAQRALSETRIEVVQIRYNLFDREEAEPVRDYCRAHGIVLEAYTPLLRGLLAGRYLEGGERPPADVQRLSRRLLDETPLPEMLRRVRALRALATENDLPMAALALHWLRSQGACPVVGASRPEQVDALVQAFARPPSPAVLARAGEIAEGG